MQAPRDNHTSGRCGSEPAAKYRIYGPRFDHLNYRPLFWRDGPGRMAANRIAEFPGPRNPSYCSNGMTASAWSDRGRVGPTGERVERPQPIGGLGERDPHPPNPVAEPRRLAARRGVGAVDGGWHNGLEAPFGSAAFRLARACVRHVEGPCSRCAAAPPWVP